MTVLDASALLAFVQQEDGRSVVREALVAGSVCGAANWSEVVQKARGAGRNVGLLTSLLASYELAVEPVTKDDAEAAAAAWERGKGLSLGDRLCLALGERLDVEVLTADASWGTRGRVRQIR